MPFLSNAERAELLKVKVPPYEEAVREVNRWMVRKALTAQALADALGLGRSTMNQWLQGSYYRLNPQLAEAQLLTRTIYAYVQARPLAAPLPPPDRWLETRNGAEIRRLFRAAVLRRACGILYGPFAAEKTFYLKCLAAERLQEGHEDVLYVRATAGQRPLATLQMIAAAAGTTVRSNRCWPLLDSLVNDFRARPRMPAVIVDEAQHLLRRPYDSLEALRDLRDLTGNDLAADRAEAEGCGLILAGSHDLFQRFERDKLLLGQWRRRITHKLQLDGMDEPEVIQVAARELGNGKPARITEELRRRLLDASREVDPYHLDAAGKPAPREYFSPAKLAVALDRMREKLARRKEHAA